MKKIMIGATALLMTMAVSAEVIQFGGKTDESGTFNYDRKINWNGVYSADNKDGSVAVAGLNSTGNGTAVVGGSLIDSDPTVGTGLAMSFIAASGVISADNNQNLTLDGATASAWSDDDYFTVRFNQNVKLLGFNFPQTDGTESWNVFLGTTTAKGAAVVDLTGTSSYTFASAPVISAGTDVTFQVGANTDSWVRSIRVETIPEPATLGLIGLAGVGILFVRRIHM